MTVREQLRAWGVNVERLLNAEMDADQFAGERDPQVQVWCDGLELEVHVYPRPLPAITETPHKVRRCPSIGRVL